MRILLADDERTITVTLGEALREAGHVVTVVSDGVQALAAIEREPFDCIITDIRMPKVDGLTVMKQAHEIQQEAYVIVITAYGSGELGFQCAREGAYAFIQKPFFNDDVVARLQELEEAWKRYPPEMDPRRCPRRIGRRERRELWADPGPADASAQKSTNKCEKCEGTGRARCAHCEGKGTIDCPKCGGTGARQ